MKLTASPKLLVGIFVLMFFIILVSSKFLSGARLDLSENGLYSLSEGTERILQSIEQPVTLTLFFSDKASSQLPALRTYAQRVEELIEEYVNLSDGKLLFEKVDPEPFSEAEDEAALAGLQGVPFGTRGDVVYFGLRIKNDSGVEEVIPFMQPDKEAYLEYELTKLISSLSKTSLPKVGVYSGLDIQGGFDYMTRQSTPAWTILDYIQQGFQIEWIDDNATEITGVDVLLLIAPQNLSEKLRFAIDQFVISGGRTIVFLDPYAETIANQGGMPTVQRFDLSGLLPNWGVKLREDVFVTDFANSMVVGVGQSRNPVRHIGLLSMNPQESVSEAGADIIIHGLESVNWSSAGILDVVEGADVEVLPLILTSDQAQPREAALLTQLADPQTLMDDFAPTGERYTLAAKISGKAKTAFPEGIRFTEKSETKMDKGETDGSENSESAENTSDEEPALEEGKEIVLAAKHLETDALRLLVVTDTDILSDRLWVQVQSFFGQQIVSPWADNGSLLVNAIENFSGHPDLIEIRSQGRFNRPFEKVEALRLDAEARFLEQQKRLEEELDATESKLVQLEQLRGEGEGAMFSDEQAAELEKFQTEKLKIRKQLRDVQHQLDQDIESLGTRLKLINIFLVPALIFLWVLIAAMRRRFA
tara:strand:+ start:13381 stop:15321 length:1941 start_codon:yes stop_codon:yes gene_type:complete